MEATLQNEILLMQLFKAGDRKAYNTVCKEFYQRILYFCRDLLRNELVAEEITQDTFMKLWERHEKFETLNNTKAFLFIAAKNDCLKFIDKNKKAKYTSIEPHENLDNDEEDHLRKMIKAELIAQISIEAESLPPKCRQIFKLFYKEGKSVNEIAVQLDVTPQTVNSQLDIAIQKLQARPFLKKLLTYIIYPILWLFLKK
jgi:RNA polymerase sigma-70 factor (ECF subfamily)